VIFIAKYKFELLRLDENDRNSFNVLRTWTTDKVDPNAITEIVERLAVGEAVEIERVS
jgi:hypothetical protein